MLPYEQREGELNLYKREKTLNRLEKIENLKEQGLSLEEIKLERE